MIPKVHKTPVKMRPIVPSHSWVTTAASKLLDSRLKPIVDKYPWCVKGTLHCLENLEEIQCFDPNIVLFAADVESLYTNIDIDEGLRRVECILRMNQVQETSFLIDLLRFVLTNNYFQFRGKYYHQIKGTAMGTNTAPSYANLFLIHVEYYWKRQIPQFPKIYFRFLDDVFFVFEQTKNSHIDEDALQDLLKRMNSQSKSLRFTFERSDVGVSFLDLFIRKSNRLKTQHKLDYRLYEKPTNLHLYTDPSSYHPSNQMYSWITGENIRLIRNCSTEKDYKIAINSFREHLLARDYDIEEINRYIKYEYSDRNRVLLKTYRETPDAFFLCKENIAGREELIKNLKLLLDLYRNWAFKKPLIPVITKGVNLWTHTRKTNKLILGSSSVAEVTDESPPGTSTGPVGVDEINTTEYPPDEISCAQSSNTGDSIPLASDQAITKKTSLVLSCQAIRIDSNDSSDEGHDTRFVKRRKF
jgi:hypothetical protein